MLSTSVPVASAARTTTGTSSAITVQSTAMNGGVGLIVSVTASSGTTPTLDLTIEWSNDGSIWAIGQPADSFTQITTTTTVSKAFVVKGSFYRVRWTIGGTTPSFTFSISEVQY